MSDLDRDVDRKLRARLSDTDFWAYLLDGSVPEYDDYDLHVPVATTDEDEGGPTGE